MCRIPKAPAIKNELNKSIKLVDQFADGLINSRILKQLK